MTIVEKFRRLVRYRQLLQELQEYSDNELTELGIARADIERIAYEACGDASQ